MDLEELFTKRLDRSDDYCTPPEAYKQIAKLLPVNPKIYDPYYCCNQTIQNILQEIPKATVYHQPVDCYRHRPDDSLYDVIVTNPPYSQKHKAFEFLAKTVKKPFLILVPSAYVFQQRFKDTAQDIQQDLVLYAPCGRYKFKNPVKNTQHAAWFESVWIGWNLALLQPESISLTKKPLPLHLSMQYLTQT